MMDATDAFSLPGGSTDGIRPELFNDDKTWVVCWHRGFISNNRDETQPRVYISHVCA